MPDPQNIRTPLFFHGRQNGQGVECRKGHQNRAQTLPTHLTVHGRHYKGRPN